MPNPLNLLVSTIVGKLIVLSPQKNRICEHEAGSRNGDRLLSYLEVVL